MSEPSAQVDQSKPSIARVYDYLLGGKDNYAADRAVGDYFINDLPGSVSIAFANRQALIRAVGEISAMGVRQFVDLGSGLPTADNVHQVAERYSADAHVVYVDNDPIVLAHGRALLATDAATTVIQADLRDPEGIRNHPEVQRLIDFEKPVAVIFSAILHHLNNDEGPDEVVRYWVDQVPSGSLFYISHFRSGHNEETRSAEEKLQATFGRGRWRNDEEILSLFGDLDVLAPGLVPCSLWRPSADAPDDTSRIGEESREISVWEELIAAALARKP
ncbi:SAM-dependent methyltransferase [Nocardia huaxiensis]|uniref:SAM-dependent methyltransferase n=1 Tax=Nocardia huaxiensis TaxID=2755382 RepID=A0A7D6VCP5_9NOCA|nr:SAM-dependent methyltransferase [Nocardia huaxiensis]QLY31991.1 SAM-dependent methyltransferase [Nocardia huaxiensis]UFS95563.1 SAM-dependent methyltransferase [Nocardia huaxiensis]